MNLKIDVNLHIDDAVNLCKAVSYLVVRGGDAINYRQAIFAFLFLVKQRCYIVVNNVSQEQVCNVLVAE